MGECLPTCIVQPDSTGSVLKGQEASIDAEQTTGQTNSTQAGNSEFIGRERLTTPKTNIKYHLSYLVSALQVALGATLQCHSGGKSVTFQADILNKQY